MKNTIKQMGEKFNNLDDWQRLAITGMGTWVVMIILYLVFVGAGSN